jgi:hypothetical protein
VRNGRASGRQSPFFKKKKYPAARGFARQFRVLEAELYRQKKSTIITYTPGSVQDNFVFC